MLALAQVAMANSNKEATADTVEVNIFQFKVEIAEALDEAAKAYEAANPGVKIVIETVGGGDDYGAALRAKNASGNMADIYNIGGPQDAKDWASMLEDLSNEPWANNVVGTENVTMDGKILGLPYNVEGYGLAYNKRIFKAAGIDASKIVDFASLEKAAMELDTKIKAGELADQFPLLEGVFEYAAKETWVTGLHTSNYALAQEFGSGIVASEAKSVNFTYGDGLKKIIDLMAMYSPSAENTALLNSVDYSTQVDTGIAIERVAIIQQGNWIYGGVSAVDQDVADNLGFLPLPIAGAKEDSIAVGVPMYWAVNSMAEDADRAAAKDFLNWLYTSETGKDIVVNKFFFIPPMKTGYENFPVADPLGQSITEYISAGRVVPWTFMGYPTDWGMGVLGVKIQGYYAGDLTWEDVVSESQDIWADARK